MNFNILQLAKRAFLFSFLAIFIFSANLAQAGFGVSPPRVLEDKLVKGSVIERTIYLVQGTPDKPANIDVTIDDSPIEDWITVTPGPEFTIPEGVQQFPIKVRIEVPEDADLGIYKAFIRVRSLPDENLDTGAGAGVSIALGGRIDVEITVGEGLFYSFRVKNVNIPDIKENQAPRAIVRVDNLGNVPAGPQRADFELFNNFGDVRLAYVQGVEMERVPAFETGETQADFPLNIRLGPGEYWGTVRLYDEDKLISEHKDIFRVNEIGFFEKHWMSLAGAILLFVIIVIFLIIRRTKKKRAR